MAAFNQSPLGQTTLSAALASNYAIGSSALAPVVFSTAAFRSDGSSGGPTWYAPFSAVQSEGRRESKMVGASPRL